MTKTEINTFIEVMEEFGDVWESEDVERVYGDRTLDDALEDRMGDMMAFGSIMSAVINRKDR